MDNIGNIGDIKVNDILEQIKYVEILQNTAIIAYCYIINFHYGVYRIATLIYTDFQ